MTTPLENAGGTSGGTVDIPASALPVEIPTAAGSTETKAHFETGKAARYSVANFGSSVVYALFNLAMPLYLGNYGVPPWLISILANERAFVGALIQPIVGRLSDRTRTPLGRRRPYFLVGVPLMSVSLLTLSTQPTFWLMLLLMTIGSFFLAIAQDPYIALLADLFPERYRGNVGGFLGLTTALGNIAFALTALVLWDSNQPLVFALVVVALLLSFAFTFFTVKEPPAETVASAHPRGKLSPASYIRGLLQYPEAAKYIGALSLFWLGSGGATPFVTLFGTRALGANDSQVFLLPLAFVVMSAIFSVPAGLLSVRFGKKPVMFVGLLIYGLGALAGSQTTDLVQATIALAVIGIGNAGTAPLNALLTDLIPRSRTAELIGVGSAVWSFVQPLGSGLAGVIVTGTALWVGGNDSYRWAFLFAGSMIVLSALALRFVHPERAVPEASTA